MSSDLTFSGSYGGHVGVCRRAFSKKMGENRISFLKIDTVTKAFLFYTSMRAYTIFELEVLNFCFPQFTEVFVGDFLNSTDAFGAKLSFKRKIRLLALR